MNRRTQIIGIDCAVAAKNTAVAHGWSENGRVIVDRVVACTPKQDAVATIGALLKDERPLLFCLDAPLGWPKRLGEALGKHRAGDPIDAEAHALFRRETDRIVKRETGQQPLDVGADRIARTAEAALSLLAAVRNRTGASIPLAWTPDEIPDASAIEVYPAATMRQLGIAARGYKDVAAVQQRRAIISALKLFADLTQIEESIVTGDELDAVLCVLAGSDFLARRCLLPSDRNSAEREGWIWVRQNNCSD
ncbi:MAG TPA: DUF429 domain-containing protein [Thermoanaerobaculia bacterium]|nr:DUF429 domain-containing protein [Thermoanaerobaculia bacterium]